MLDVLSLFDDVSNLRARDAFVVSEVELAVLPIN